MNSTNVVIPKFWFTLLDLEVGRRGIDSRQIWGGEDTYLAIKNGGEFTTTMLDNAVVALYEHGVNAEIYWDAMDRFSEHFFQLPLIAVNSAPTLRQALEILSESIGFFHPQLKIITHLLDDGDVEFWIADRSSEVNAEEVGALAWVYYFCCFLRLAKNIVNNPKFKAHAGSIHVRYPTEHYTALADRIPSTFSDNNPMRFIQFSQEVLDLESQYRDDELHQVSVAMLRQRALAVNSETMTQKTTQLIYSDPTVFNSINPVADSLNLSVRTLTRRLSDEGTTFRKLVDNVRLELAMMMLKNQGLSISETSYRLGFADASSFARTFKRWTGLSPQQVESRHR
ncbi:helix-turn-helix domain-containing protein [uncultured Vibrio sp.]|uniref:helix-turn-helix transcriptional regulator n=1 Tax=uncultured Vibrio sp. TaxID=114054 RepID=UPI0025CCB324|nr:helix-turn-helix domain-containing protein [uncultured Vibrio sp.]